MKKTLIVALFFASFLGFSQNNLELSSETQGINAPMLIIKSTTENLSEGFSIEVANYECDTSSKYLENPITYSSDQAGFKRTSDNSYTFTTPFNLEDLQSKWFKWRVITSQGTSSAWTCFSWSDYCDAFLDKNGDCK